MPSVAVTSNRVLTTYISISRCLILRDAARLRLPPPAAVGAIVRKTAKLGVAPGVALGTLIGAQLAYDLMDGVEEGNDRYPLILYVALFIGLIIINIAAAVYVSFVGGWSYKFLFTCRYY